MSSDWDLQEIKGTLYQIEYRMKLDQEYHQKLRRENESLRAALMEFCTCYDPHDTCPICPLIKQIEEGK